MTPPARQVVHILGALDVGGAETRALELCQALPASEVSQTFVCLSGRKGELAPQFLAAGAKVIPLRISWRPSFVIQLFLIFRRHRPAVVMSHVSLTSGVILAVAWAARADQRIARMHSTGDSHDTGMLRRAYRYLAATLLGVTAQQISGVTQSSLDWVQQHGATRRRIAARSVVMPNAIDLDRYRPPSTPPPLGPGGTVLYLGRASPEKNRAHLVPIQRELLTLGPWKTLVAGEGGSDDLSKSLPEGLQLLGARSDAPDLLRQANVLVLPSFREGLPGVILEALATGVPVVASDLPTIRELAETMPGIWLVSLDEPVHVWAEAIQIAARSADAATLRGSMVDSQFDLKKNVSVWRDAWSA
ncbi:glycosyltransferase involved in cell wall biosynthesis [Aeromicrobium panaciterrae]|uniref:Glycosyltransferase involved in cell wall biosynthesis n=1 Tax=Aeromicrobium panaciterrae TaxID=363861 RepID=A0ABU1UL72_9ACTN|nr:glycosyltransferase [Aeromicrobium panaciterrae]MDR7085926.1 glycosyltransferase involved in cell wall biosynthesis [Aeromicrobium panaciterrae]